MTTSRFHPCPFLSLSLSFFLSFFLLSSICPWSIASSIQWHGESASNEPIAGNLSRARDEILRFSLCLFDGQPPIRPSLFLRAAFVSFPIVLVLFQAIGPVVLAPRETLHQMQGRGGREGGSTTEVRDDRNQKTSKDWKRPCEDAVQFRSVSRIYRHVKLLRSCCRSSGILLFLFFSSSSSFCYTLLDW